MVLVFDTLTTVLDKLVSYMPLVESAFSNFTPLVIHKVGGKGLNCVRKPSKANRRLVGSSHQINTLPNLLFLLIFSPSLPFFSQNNSGCFAPLGMEDGLITDVQVSSSSRLDDNHSPSQARLNFKEEGNKAGGWSAQTNDKNQWLQVDLSSYTRVTRVATQGLNANDEWVTKYKLQYSDDGKNFQYYKQQGDNEWTVRLRL